MVKKSGKVLDKVGLYWRSSVDELKSWVKVKPAVQRSSASCGTLSAASSSSCDPLIIDYPPLSLLTLFAALEALRSPCA